MKKESTKSFIKRIMRAAERPPQVFPRGQYFTKSQLAKLTGVKAETFKRWVSEGMVPAAERGGGRSKQSLFVDHAVVWALTLGEVFRAGGTFKTPIFTWEPFMPDDTGAWVQRDLKNGDQIIEYLSETEASNVPVALLLIMGYEGTAGKPPAGENRFAQLNLAPAERILGILAGRLRDRHMIYAFGNDMSKEKGQIVRSETVFNIDQFYRQVEYVCERGV